MSDAVSPSLQQTQTQTQTLPLTPSQTVGPFLHIALAWPDGPDVVPDGTAGAIRLVGRVTDGAGEAVGDALIETWQADPDGGFAFVDDPHGFRGFGRCPTEADGSYVIRTLLPGPLRGPNGALEAPHIDVSIFARGLLDRLVTRIYFPDDPVLAQDPVLAHDPVLSTVPEARRRTLLAVRDGEDTFRFDIVLQGPDETVFFDL